MNNIKEQVKKCADTKKPVLILGETGTGKSHYAKTIHLNSKRKNKRFIRLNINSLNSNLFESELFGHEKGAFSGAINTKQGFCEAVGDGTLFIDEIGDLSLELQAKLLTLIDENIFHRVGSCEERRFRGRLIFATNRNLIEMVSKGEFRKDLYFRLRYFLIELDPLRSKSQVFQIILQEINNARIRFQGQRIKFSPQVLEVLERYSWPGNYREMKNTVEYLFELNKSEVGINDVPSWLKEGAVLQSPTEKSLNYLSAITNFEIGYYRSLLTECNGSIKDSVQVSGISKVTIISKLKKYGIDRRLYKVTTKDKRAYGF